ncbi:PD-(D/E)XK motif protein [Rhizobium ruizarguesonis]|uniref:PD-(D/E)XK motif protein n=1 Tax=Rhizobium ruizarguesonis TaxID=2081791 RepID=UPI00102F6196|nr:PD-(D/E)XK motif protein [Rhizobium ruizarguesonis]TBA06375.1 PD-(D/E)XK motif protein [Rhizobium ruizarguesonis]
MILNNTPWAGLEAGKVDTRRVNASGRWNFFWAVLTRSDAALVLQLSQLPNPLLDLPKLRSLDIHFQTLPGGPILYIRLNDAAQVELFETLCRDVVAAAETAEDEVAALQKAIGRTFRWHHLLRGGKDDLLQEEAQKGLIGELKILKLLVENMGAKAAIEAWTGPSGAPKDFELRSDCIEVKARRGASQPFVKISNEYQLAEVEGRRLWLAVLAVDRVQPPNGLTLADHVAGLTRALECSAPSAIKEFDLRLADAGYDPMHDYSAWHWQASEAEFHAVEGNFPRLSAPVPLGVSHLSYSVSLGACAPFRTDWAIVRATLFEEGADERA